MRPDAGGSQLQGERRVGPAYGPVERQLGFWRRLPVPAGWVLEQRGGSVAHWPLAWPQVSLRRAWPEGLRGWQDGSVVHWLPASLPAWRLAWLQAERRVSQQQLVWQQGRRQDGSGERWVKPDERELLAWRPGAGAGGQQQVLPVPGSPQRAWLPQASRERPVLRGRLSSPKGWLSWARPLPEQVCCRSRHL